MFLKRKKLKIIFIAVFGNFLEHYDKALYGFLAPFIAHLFFPHKDFVISLFLSYLIFPLGMLIRPLGSLFFGLIGDSYGRKKTLVISLLGMGITTFFIGVIPSYQTIGYLAPLFLLLGRILQNFFSSGETIGGAVLLIESLDEQEKDFYSGVYDASSVAGGLIASFFVSIAYFFGGVEKYWRALYFLGGATALLGSYLRKQNVKGFKEVIPETKMEITKLWNYRLQVVLIAVVAGFSYATYTLAFILMNGLIPLVTEIKKEMLIHINSYLLMFDFIALPFFGFLAKKYGRNQMMMQACLLAILLGFPLFSLLKGASLSMVILIRVAIVGIGVCFSATFHSWSQSIVPKHARCTVISFAYALGVQIFGSVAPAVSLWLYHVYQEIAFASFFWVFLASLSGACIFFSSKALQEKPLMT